MSPAVPLAMFPILPPSTPMPTGHAAMEETSGDITEPAIGTQGFCRNSKSLRKSVSLTANQAPLSRVAVNDSIASSDAPGNDACGDSRIRFASEEPGRYTDVLSPELHPVGAAQADQLTRPGLGETDGGGGGGGSGGSDSMAGFSRDGAGNRCDKCKKVVVGLRDMKKHIKSHNTNHWPFQCSHRDCDELDERFTRRHDLKRHERSVHAPTTVHVCDSCDKDFKRKDVLKRHKDVCRRAARAGTGPQGAVGGTGGPSTAL
ncbi:hypothetical protein HK405_014202 [Cladochytrium tenue]|nr:hypothetical protein HK405_014202 [Cladochytrium tenue]